MGRRMGRRMGRSCTRISRYGEWEGVCASEVGMGMLSSDWSVYPCIISFKPLLSTTCRVQRR